MDVSHTLSHPEAYTPSHMGKRFVFPPKHVHKKDWRQWETDDRSVSCLCMVMCLKPKNGGSSASYAHPGRSHVLMKVGSYEASTEASRK